MSYMLLIVEPQGQRGTRSAEEGHAAYQRMLDYAQHLEARGVLRGVNSLRRDSVRIARRDGKTNIVDGPFTEAKDFIGGYFLLECATLQQARAFAAECPAAEWATIEIREIGPCYA
jgi:hypothetical protein